MRFVGMICFLFLSICYNVSSVSDFLFLFLSWVDLFFMLLNTLEIFILGILFDRLESWGKFYPNFLIFLLAVWYAVVVLLTNHIVFLLNL